jgi:hypothetical protein
MSYQSPSPNNSSGMTEEWPKAEQESEGSGPGTPDSQRLKHQTLSWCMVHAGCTLPAYVFNMSKTGPDVIRPAIRRVPLLETRFGREASEKKLWRNDSSDPGGG